MSLLGCQHLQAYKQSNKNKSTIKWIHGVFVVTSNAKSLKTKLGNSRCKVCKNRGPYMHACLECVFFGCHQHIREHAANEEHSMTMDLTYGQIHCSQCQDYIYDSELDTITTDSKTNAKTLRRRLCEIDTYGTNEEEREFLKTCTKKLCIAPNSTIGLRGLVNLGSTCFINVVIQALIHTPLLRDYFLTETHTCKGIPGGCLVCEVAKLFQKFYNGSNVPLALHELLFLIWNQVPTLSGDKQHDAHEFLTATLELLHRHYRASIPNLPSKCPCIIDEIFLGGLQSDVVCKNCNGVSPTTEDSWDFSLDLGYAEGPPSTLVDCLIRFTKEEDLGEQVAIFCSTCQSHQQSTKQLTLKILPVVLIFHLKRFELSKTIKKKITTKISFPEILDMTPFLSRSKNESPFPKDNRFSLFAVINHVGTSVNVGHYTAYIRQLQDCWYKCDDDMITRVTLDEVLESEGYLLFYHKHVLEYD